MKKVVNDIKFKKNIYSKPIIKKEELVEPIKNSENDIKKDIFEPKDILYTYKNKKNKNKKILKYFIFIIFFLLLFYKISVYFENVIIEINPKSKIFDLDQSKFVASDNNNNFIDYEIMIVKDSTFVKRELSLTKELSLKSRGVITFYNEYSEKIEKIPAKSHIFDDNGKTYILDKDIIVPGYKKENNIILPGSIDASITAFLPGEAYDTKSENFTIANFKNTPKFNKIYAKIKEDISGGAEGLVYVATDEIKKEIDQQYKNQLKDNLFKKLQGQIPEGYLVYKDANIFDYKIKDVYSKESNAEIEISGTMMGILLKKDDFINHLKSRLLSDIKEEEYKQVEFLDIDKLEFDFINENQNISKEMKDIDFTLSGQIIGLWSPQIDNLVKSLPGVRKDSVNEIFKNDPGILSATVKIFPPWQKSLPTDKTKIKIEVQQYKN